MVVVIWLIVVFILLLIVATSSEKDGRHKHKKRHTREPQKAKRKNDSSRGNKSYIRENYRRDGFLNPQDYPVALTNHARDRIRERVGNVDADKLTREAYVYGKSSYQMMRTSAAILKEIEERHENGIALLYRGYIFIFSEENVLITMYKNEKVIA